LSTKAEVVHLRYYALYALLGPHIIFALSVTALASYQQDASEKTYSNYDRYEQNYDDYESYDGLRKTEPQHLHHFFNARLLRPKEQQISIYGNFKVGLSDDWEFGSQPLGVLIGAPNVALKHRMFSTGRHDTSFTSHSFYMSHRQDRALDDKEVTFNTFISAFGVITTTTLEHGHYLNWGLLDFYIRHSLSVDSLKLNSHILAPVIGYDYYISPSLAFSGVITYPALLIGKLESDYADADIMAFLTNIPSNVNPWTMFLTAVYTNGRFNIEGGIVAISGMPLPYLNLFWRFS